MLSTVTLQAKTRFLAAKSSACARTEDRSRSLLLLLLLIPGRPPPPASVAARLPLPGDEVVAEVVPAVGERRSLAAIAVGLE
jgi:hypothetical protein